MINKPSLTISFEDLFKQLIGLVADDLKVHKHLYHLSLGGLDTSLHLQLHHRIFILAGFKEGDISAELEDWYFEQTKRVYAIEVMEDEESLLALSSEILTGLLKMRREVYARNVGKG